MRTLSNLGSRLDTFMLHSVDELREDYGVELKDYNRHKERRTKQQDRNIYI